MSELKEFDDGVEEKFPEEYSTETKIKAPLNCLWYNVNFEFKDNYPAKMPEDFARDMIKMFSNKGDIIWDGFCGSGTVPRIANQMGRIGYGSDINPKAIDLCKKHDKENDLLYQVADVRTMNAFGHKKIDLIISSPPFGISIGGDKNNYSDEKNDISNSKSYEEFLEKIKPAFQSYFDHLKPNGMLIFDARDRTKGSIYFDLIRHFVNICVDVGFKVHAKFFYFLMPWSLYTFKNRENHHVVPNVSTMDVYVMYKPEQGTLLS